jgi:hypothetical protein
LGIEIMTYLSLYDLTGIQPYIFGSNVLQENLGGSFLVKQALDDWLKACVATVPGACFQWSGGGNAMVTATSLADATAIANALSLRLHQDAPGLSVVCAHVGWDGSDGHFRTQRGELHRQLHAHKAGQWPPALFDGAGIARRCSVTGEPAVRQDQDDRWLGAAADRRRACVDRAREDLEGLYRLRDDLIWASEFDLLGRSHGDRSMLGVIHFDGNGMGHRFAETGSMVELQDLSAQVEKAGRLTLVDALAWVTDNLSGISDPDVGGFELSMSRDREAKPCFPVHPIVYGGDDITLVCDARIALDLAAKLLTAWNRHTRELLKSPAHACAGVALVRAHYPFYRAYELAEQLCRGAKSHLRKIHDGHDEHSALDWEFIAGAGLATLDERRKHGNLYRAVSDEKEALHARPYYVIGDPPVTAAYRRWDWFRRTLVHALQKQEENHTRVKDLASVLQQGARTTKVHLDRWRDRFGLSRAEEREEREENGHRPWLPEPRGIPMPDGFPNGETPYLDAIELMDRILPLACYSADTDNDRTQTGVSP